MATSANDLNADHDSCAAWIARFLKARGVDRIFGLQGGHIQPIWDHAAQLGIRIVDVRHEVAAVHMAHAHAELTGQLGVAMVTAGPGVTNTTTAVANASLARMPVLVIGGCTSRAQANLGPLQDIPHVDILRPVTRQSRTLRVADQVIREFDEGVSRALGDLGEPGPVYLEIPTDVLRAHVAPGLILDEWMQPKTTRVIPPDPTTIARTVDALWSAKRPLVVTGRGARQAGPEIVRLLDALGAVYLDTQESRGLVSSDHPSVVGSMRAAAMTEADTVFVIGRKLDYQLGYGSPAVFPKAKFIRLADSAGELLDNRRGDPEILATPALALDAIVVAAGNRQPSVDKDWVEGLQKRHRERSAKVGPRYTTGSDGGVDPRAIFQALRDKAKPDYIAIADGGDLLSFARVGLEARTYMDAGAFGCLGVGVPYAVAAALARPDQRLRHWRRRLRAQRHGDRHRGSSSRQDRSDRLEQRRVEYRAPRSGVQLRRSGGRHPAGAFRLRRHGSCPGRSRRAGREARAACRRHRARALANAPALVDVVTSQTVISSDATKGLGFVPEFQPLTAWDDLERKRRGLA
jgi:acetolactate synthase-1/2/3 large subunit